MIQDQINLNSTNSLILPMKCYLCSDTTHFVNNCPFIHFVSDKEKVIKKNEYSHPQERRSGFQRKNKKRKVFLFKSLDLQKQIQMLHLNPMSSELDSSFDSESLHSQSVEQKSSLNIEDEEDDEEEEKNENENFENSENNENTEKSHKNKYKLAKQNSNENILSPPLPPEKKKQITFENPEPSIVISNQSSFSSITENKKIDSPCLLDRNCRMKHSEKTKSLSGDKMKSFTAEKNKSISTEKRKSIEYLKIDTRHSDQQKNENEEYESFLGITEHGIDKIAHFKNYFPKFNFCSIKNTIERIPKISKKKRTEMQRLSQYTFFMDTLYKHKKKRKSRMKTIISKGGNLSESKILAESRMTLVGSDKKISAFRRLASQIIEKNKDNRKSSLFKGIIPKIKKRIWTKEKDSIIK